MNALGLLKQDHEKVMELFGQVKATENDRQRKQLYKKIRTEIETHMYIEEKVFYPELKRRDEFREMALEAIEEHHQVKTLIREIDRLSEDSEQFAPKLKVMGDNIEHHIEMEEDELFPHVEGRFSGEQLEEMGRELEAAKKEFGRKARTKAA